VTAVGFEAERWYADKGRRAVGLERLDALGELEIVRVRFVDGSALYTLVPERPDWERVLAQAARGFAYDGRLPVGGAEPLAVDQSHSSWRVGSAYLKCYRRLVAGTHPEVELLAALGECGFLHVPAYRGLLSWGAPSGEQFAVAVVQEFVEGGEEGWEWASALAIAGDASFAGEIGSITRRLHEVLAAALPSRVATALDRAAWAEEASAQLERALAVEPSLAAVAGRAGRELARLATASDPALLSRVHGDLHVGQFLRAGDRFVIVDFEGQPAKSVEERRALDTPLRDLASLSRSLDHCGRYAVRRRGADAERTEAWIAEARERLLDGYGNCNRSVLRALEWERALYEFTYAATHLPEWMYAPRGGLEALVNEPDRG
jgi:predicted trehalose synthase